MTEQLPWRAGGAPSDPASDERDDTDGRTRTAVDGSLRLEPRRPRHGDPARDEDRTRPASGTSAGDWPQPGSEDLTEQLASRRRMRQMWADAPPPISGPAPEPAAPAFAPGPSPVFPPPPGAPLQAPPLQGTPLQAPPRGAPVQPPAQPAVPPPAPPPRPQVTTGELEVYGLGSRRDAQRRSYRRDPARPEVVGAESGDSAGFKGGVERWSRWAAGLGRPPRDARGGRRYPGREGLLPPAVWVTAAIATAAVVGLLGGVLVTAGSSNATVTTAIATTTVRVTNATTAPPVTMTTTRTRTKTVTVSPTPTAPPAGGQQGGQGLGPGSQGPQVAVLQQALGQLGLFQGNPTGVYDQQTQGAVQAFQARAGITQDPPGVAGPTTLQAINQAVGR